MKFLSTAYRDLAYESGISRTNENRVNNNKIHSGVQKY